MKRQVSLRDRTFLSQKEYMDLLATPTKRPTGGTEPKKKKIRCRSCSPRIDEMAVPKHQVYKPIRKALYSNWREYQNSLPPVARERFTTCLRRGNQGLDPKAPNSYFKQVDNTIKYIAKNQMNVEQKKQPAYQQQRRRNNSAPPAVRSQENKQGRRNSAPVAKTSPKNKGGRINSAPVVNAKWYDAVADHLAGTICECLDNVPVTTLDYHQMLMAKRIARCCNLTKENVHSKKTKSLKHKTLINFAEKAAKYLDQIADMSAHSLLAK